MTRNILIGLAVASVWAVGGAATALEVPLTVAERAGVRRVGEPVAGGVPMPLGAIKDLSTLRLLDDAGKEAPAQFSQLGTWWSDNSVKWVLVQFLANVQPGTLRTWTLTDGGAGQAKGALSAEQADGGVTVTTGKIRFTVKPNGFNLFDKVWLDDSGGGNYDDAHLVVKGGCDLVVTNNFPNRSSYVDYKASDFADTKVELEEAGPIRAVVKVTGAHGAGGENRALDYVLRIHAFADKSYVKLVYTAQCKQGSVNTYVPVDRWTVRIAPNFADQGAGVGLGYSFGTEGAAVAGRLKPGARRAFLRMDDSDRYTIGGSAYHGAESGVLTGRGKSVKPFQLGWVDLSGSKFGVLAGVRHFWQLNPKALEVDSTGLKVHLWPGFVGPRVPLVGGQVGEKQARFFGGMSKTHELLVYFRPAGGEEAAPGGRGQPASVVAREAAWAFLQAPLLATCPTAWYCQQTRAFGRLVDADPASFKPQYRQIAVGFENHMRLCLDSLLGRRDFNRGLDQYGLFNFGDHINHVEDDRRDKSGETAAGPDIHWDNNYYRFPHLMYLQFVRTGHPGYFDVATEANTHLGDVDTLCWPENVAGAVRYCAGPDHVRFVGDHLKAAEVYVSDTFNHFKIQSHFERYYLTGDRLALERGLCGAQWARRQGTNALSQARSVGHGTFALLAGYEATGDTGYLAVARKVALATRSGIGAGIMADGARSYYEATGDEEASRRAVELARKFVEGGGVPSNAIQAVGFAYGRTGEQRYLDAVAKSIRGMSSGLATDVHGFGLGHSGVQYGFWFLTDLPRDEKPIAVKAP